MAETDRGEEPPEGLIEFPYMWTTPARAVILTEVEMERREQDSEWGGAAHDDQHGPGDWVLILSKWVGRASMTLISADARVDWGALRRAFLVVAAVAVAAVEWVDRRTEGHVDA